MIRVEFNNGKIRDYDADGWAAGTHPDEVVLTKGSRRVATVRNFFSLKSDDQPE